MNGTGPAYAGGPIDGIEVSIIAYTYALSRPFTRRIYGCRPSLNAGLSKPDWSNEPTNAAYAAETASKILDTLNTAPTSSGMRVSNAKPLKNGGRIGSFMSVSNQDGPV